MCKAPSAGDTASRPICFDFGGGGLGVGGLRQVQIEAGVGLEELRPGYAGRRVVQMRVSGLWSSARTSHLHTFSAVTAVARSLTLSLRKDCLPARVLAYD